MAPKVNLFQGKSLSSSDGTRESRYYINATPFVDRRAIVDVSTAATKGIADGARTRRE